MRRICLSVAALIAAIVPAFAPADEWPGFLGARRDGISDEKGLIDAIPADGPKTIWRVPGGVGMSAVAVADGLAITSWNDNGKQWLVALDAATGKEAWKTPLGAAYENGQGNGPRATPTIAGERVFAFSGEGILVAVSRTEGKILWQVDAVGEAEAKPSDYGMASSPLVVAEQVIVHVGGATGAIAAFSIADGKPVWKASAGSAGYSSPTLLAIDGMETIVSVTGTEVVGLRPGSGKELWRFPFETDFGCNTATPIVVDGGVFVSAGENQGSVLIDLEPEGDRYAPRARWESLGPKSLMRNEWQTSIVIGDHLYGFDNVGAAGPVTHLVCLEAKTGREAWRKSRFGKGNMVFADGKLWITTFEGELVLARATPEGYEELGRAELLGRTRQTLTIAGGRGYIRDDREVLCIGLE
jgi:outer membrane protein assembly factor BamB